MLRFLAQYPNDRSLVEERLRSIKAAEYQAALGHFARARVMDAAGIAIAESGFCPTIFKILEVIKRLAPPPVRRAYKPADEDDGRYHPLPPEESARRAALAKTWKAQYGFCGQAQPQAPADDLETLKRPFNAAEIESCRRLTGKTEG